MHWITVIAAAFGGLYLLYPKIERKNKFKTEDYQVKEPKTTNTNMMNNKKSANTHAFAQMAELISSSLDKMQSEYEVEEQDDLLRYYAEYQGGHFVIDVREEQRCRVVFPGCFRVPTEEYTLALEAMNEFNWYCSYTNAICILSEDDVSFNLYCDVSYRKDIDEFRSFLASIMSDCFACSRFLEQHYNKVKKDKQDEEQENLIDQARSLLHNKNN